MSRMELWAIEFPSTKWDQLSYKGVYTFLWGVTPRGEAPTQTIVRRRSDLWNTGSSFIFQGERAPSLPRKCNHCELFMYNWFGFSYFQITRGSDKWHKWRSMSYGIDHLNRLADRAAVWTWCRLASQTLQSSPFIPPSLALSWRHIRNHSLSVHK